jgi:hypothetical protein
MGQLKDEFHSRHFDEFGKYRNALVSPANEISRIWAHLDGLENPDVGNPITETDNRDEALRVAVEALRDIQFGGMTQIRTATAAEDALEKLKAMGVEI